MKVIWSVLAESSAVDRDSNNVSLFNIIEEAQIPQPPEPPNSTAEGDPLSAVPLRCVLVTLFGRTEADRGEKRETRLVVTMPNGRVVETDLRFEVDLEVAHRNRTRVNVSTLPWAGQGEYRFQIQGMDESGEWQMMSEAPLQVTYLMNDEGAMVSTGQ